MKFDPPYTAERFNRAMNSLFNRPVCKVLAIDHEGNVIHVDPDKLYFPRQSRVCEKCRGHYAEDRCPHCVWPTWRYVEKHIQHLP